MRHGLARLAWPALLDVLRDGFRKDNLAPRRPVTLALVGHRSTSQLCLRMPKRDGLPCATLFGRALDGAALSGWQRQSCKPVLAASHGDVCAALERVICSCPIVAFA